MWRETFIPERLADAIESIRDQSANPQENAYYIAGPPALIQAMTGILLGKGIPAEMTKVDAWKLTA